MTSAVLISELMNLDTLQMAWLQNAATAQDAADIAAAARQEFLANIETFRQNFDTWTTLDQQPSEYSAMPGAIGDGKILAGFAALLQQMLPLILQILPLFLSKPVVTPPANS